MEYKTNNTFDFGVWFAFVPRGYLDFLASVILFYIHATMKPKNINSLFRLGFLFRELYGQAKCNIEAKNKKKTQKKKRNEIKWN